MDSVLDQITLWIKTLLVSGIMENLTGLFDSVNTQVGDIATQVGRNPASFSPGIFSMIRAVSESVVIPIAGIILTFVACYELIQMLIEHNNLANFETWTLFKWIFKTYVAVMLITNTFNIVMAVFDVAQHVINRAGGLIGGVTAVDATALETMQTTLESMELGPLFGLFFQSMIVQITIKALSVVIFVIVYGRMIEIYLMTSLAPIPFSTFGNRRERDKELEDSTYTMPEIANLLMMSRKEVYFKVIFNPAYEPLFDFVFIGNRRRITKESFEAWYQSQNKYKKFCDLTLEQQEAYEQKKQEAENELKQKELLETTPRLLIDPNKSAYSAEEAAVLLDVKYRDLLDMISRGELEAKKYGHKYLIHRDEISWWLLQQKLYQENINLEGST